MGREREGAAPEDDQALARRAREGDEGAFAALVQRYQGPAFNFAYRLLGDYDEAVEAAQQAFVQLYTALPSLDLERPLRPWLFRILRNRCIDAIRQRHGASLSAGRGREDDDEAGITLEDTLRDPGPLPEDLLERADLQNLLVAAISRLPPRYREVVALRYTTELTFAEIAAALGIPENTAKIHFHRAKARLREALRELM